ncbi:ATP-binding protein [Hymenobacter convexus]|uniref:ATP-binding protein n=1 Tax=Hymenobacter sp. CA1UV-4 TaxID=3063782 RepID=UPI0027129C1C|nr:ATP-binding protein [Hymenobacter sp. CA1UV-4]MDO7851982.1 histidine kinase [Hymenobacter sp. CA1UV-4]
MLFSLPKNPARTFFHRAPGRLLLRGLLLLGLLAGPGMVRAQGPPLPLARLAVVRDSLTRLLARDQRPDTQRVSRLNTLAFALRMNEAEESRRLTRQALRLAQQLRFEHGLLEALFNLSYYQRAHSQYDSAVYYARLALPLAARTGNRYTQTRVYYNLARIYQEQGNYAAALGPSLDGLALARAMGNARVLLFQLVMAARIELALGEYASARAYMNEARPLAGPAHDLLSTAYLSQVAGDLSRQQGQWRAARAHYSQALASYAVVLNKPGLVEMQLRIGEMDERLGNYSAARRAGRAGLRQSRAAARPEQVAQAALLLARAWLPTHPDSARHYAEQALATARPHHLRVQARDAAQLLARATDRLGQGHAAYRYQALAGAYADSIGGEDNGRRLAAVLARAARSRTQMELNVVRQRERLLRQRQELEHLRTQRQLVGIGALVLGVVLLAGGLFWRYRRRQQQRLASRDAALRQRLAADLHDDVGALLTQISLQSDLLREAPAAPEITLARLNRLSDTSRRAARQMADVVWGLHTSSEQLPEVLAHMRDHAHEVLANTHLTVDFAVSPAAATLQPGVAVCQSLYLIYKEALHNVVKHAHTATRVTVRLSQEGSQLCLSVRDDAPGPAPTARAGGHGLANMRQRAEAVGGALHFVAEATGFGVVACLPA